MKKSSLGIFAQQESKTGGAIKKVKGQETMPQPFRKQRVAKDRRQNARYKTTPVTLQELSKIEELEPLPSTGGESKSTQSLKKSKRKKVEAARAKMDEEDSDSDFDKMVEVNYEQIAEKQQIIREMKEMQEIQNFNEGKAYTCTVQKISLYMTLIHEIAKQGVDVLDVLS